MSYIDKKTVPGGMGRLLKRLQAKALDFLDGQARCLRNIFNGHLKGQQVTGNELRLLFAAAFKPLFKTLLTSLLKTLFKSFPYTV